MIKINYESDFKLTEKTEERFADVPFEFVYTTNSGTYTASYDGEVYKNCKRNEDGSVTVIFNNHGLGVGKLKVRREFFIPDEDFPDGVYNAVSNDTTDIMLVEGKTDGYNVEEDFQPPYIGIIVGVIDNLDSDDADKALSARQGKELKGMIPTKVSELENDEGYISEIPEGYATKDDVSKAVSGKQDALTLTVKNNGNIVIGNIAGQSKEFMPATPSGDPMHYAYVSAGAEYNAKDNFILKNSQWKNMVDTIEDKAKWGLDVVDASRVKQMYIGNSTYNYATENRTSPEGGTYLRYFLVGQGSDGVWVEDETKVLCLPGCWFFNGLGDITNAEMRRILFTDRAFATINRGLQNTKARTLAFGGRVEIQLGQISLNSGYLESFSGFESSGFGIPSYFNLFLASATRYCSQLKWNSNIGVYCTPVKEDSQVRVFYINGITSGLKVLSKYLSKPSVKNMIEKAAPTSAITITLHADVYARLADDADIVAALEAKPLVTLASA